MSVQHGSSSLDPPDDTLAADLRSAAAVIKNGAFLSPSQAPLAERNNFVAPSQVDGSRSRGTLMTDKPLEEQSTMSRALALFRTGGDVLLPPVMQSRIPIHLPFSPSSLFLTILQTTRLPSITITIIHHKS